MPRARQPKVDITMPAEGEPIQLQRVYLRKMGRQQDMQVWVVDGSRVRAHVFDEFLEGGNDQRYRFVPPGEAWVDGATSSEEYEYALEHELHERHLMQSKGLSYDRAHTSALMLELDLRRKMRRVCQQHELMQKPMPSVDVHGTQEIEDIGDKVELRDIYRYRLRVSKGLTIWIVDGSHIRRDIFPDFGFSGNDLSYQYIPANEIWIDSLVDCFELEYQITHQLAMRAAMARGSKEEDAYGVGSEAQLRQRRLDEQQSRRKEANTPPVEGGTRARGVRSTSNNLKRTTTDG